MKLVNGAEIRNKDDLERLKNKIDSHYDHFIDIFSQASGDLNTEEIQKYFITVDYTITVCYYDDEPEEEEEE